MTNSIRTFPIEGVRAVNAPLTKIEFRPDSGLVFSKDENDDFNGDIRELSGDFDQIRSMLIFVDVDCKLEGIYEEAVPLQAGWNPLQNLPEQTQFQLDLGSLTKNLQPSNAQVQVYMFDTETLPIPTDSKKVRSVKEADDDGDGDGVSIDSTDWKTIILQPSFPYDSETITFSNEGSNDLEYRILLHQGGSKRAIPNASGDTVRTWTPTDGDKIFTNQHSSEFIELQARQATTGNPTTITAEYTGEN